MWDRMLGLRELLARAGPVAGVALHPLVRLWLAVTRAYVHASLEQLALAVSDPGLAAGRDTGPPRNLRKVSDLRVQLRPFRNTRAVRELDGQILTGS